MKRVVLELPAEVYTDLMRHLLPTNQKVEHAAFAFVAVADTPAGVRLRHVEHLKLGAGDYAEQHANGFELTDEARARIIERAHDLGAAIVEFHSHLGPWPAAFSGSDRAGFEDFVPHVWWRLKGKPYGAVVVASCGLDAIAWVSDPRTPQPLEFLVDGRRIEMSRISLPRWRAQDERFDRNVRLFGEEGQARLARARVAVVGIGGLGTAVVQQLSYLGVGWQAHIDDQYLKKSGLNRYIGARHDDPIPGTPKVGIAARLAGSIDPQISVTPVLAPLSSNEAFDAITNADYVFGCVDNDGARFILNELCAAHAIPYFDLASDVLPGKPTVYGGHVCVAWDGNGCPVCMSVIDVEQAQRDIAGAAHRENTDAIYGVKSVLLGEAGPAVVSINGVVACLAVTEFMVAVTGLRAPKRLLRYYGHLGTVSESRDQPQPDCYYCKHIRGTRDAADVQRYISQLRQRKKQGE